MAALLHDYSYPVKDIISKTGLSVAQFKKLYQNLDQRGVNISVHKEELPILAKGFELMLAELNDNDFANLIELRKPQARKLVELLKQAYLGKLSGITSDMWLTDKEDWQAV